MAINNYNIVSLSSTILTQNYFPIRNILERIPTEYQTTELTKFFNSNINYWFTPGNAQTYNGYVGPITEWYNPNTDNYIIESNEERGFYQFGPSITTKDTSGNINKIITYTDVINSLQQEGCDTTNQDRLFSSDYFSWCPPIDIDKFVNYEDYYWVSDINNYFTLKGKQDNYYVKVNGLPDIDGYTSIDVKNVSITVSEENYVIEYNGSIIPPSFYTENNGVITFNFASKINDKISIIYQTDAVNDIIGKETINPQDFGLENINNGMRITFLNDKNSYYNSKKFIICGIGSSIELTEDIENYINLIGNSVQYSIQDSYLLDENFITSGMTKDNIKIYIDDILVPSEYFTYDGVLTVKILPEINSNSSVVIYTASNIENYFNTFVTNLYGISLNRGLIINITNDINPEYDGIHVVSFDNNLFNVERYDEFYDPDYITIQKGSFDTWSRKNRWFHKDNINVDLNSSDRAIRPIIEFFNNIELYNYGNYRRLDVDFITTSKTNLDSLASSNGSFGIIDGVRINKEYIQTNAGYVRLLVTNDVNSNYTNKIMQLYLDSNNNYALSISNDGIKQDGDPNTGDFVYIKSGSNAGKEYNYNGTNWVVSQSKNNFPLFNLYDENGVVLSDNSVYPNSNFNGNTLFQYQEGSGTNDTILGFPLSYNSDGNILFENTLYSQNYTYGIITNTINSENLYYKIGNVFENNWVKSTDKTKQFVRNTYTFDGIENSVILPNSDCTIENIQLYDASLTDYPYVNVVENYSIDGDILTLNFVPVNGSKLIVDTYSKSSPAYGYYDLPNCLTINPDNEFLTEISYNESLSQFNSIIGNNWLTTSPNYSLGKDIIIQESDFLLTGLLTTSDIFNPTNTISFVKKEYTKYKNNFLKFVYDYYTNSRFNTNTISDMCQEIITIMAQGNNKNSPFYNTGIAKTSVYTQENYIPTTPSMEGMYNIYLPQIVEDTSMPQKDNGAYQTFIKCHDGSLVLTYGDYSIDSNGNITNINYNPIDFIYLEFENRVYNTLGSFDNDYSYFDQKPGYFRNTDYDLEDYNLLLKQYFDEWCYKNNVDGYSNSNKDGNNSDNPFSWNWSYVVDKDNNFLQGSYKAIYDYYYDTFEPHLKPWEMLGITVKPKWWDNEYGTAPYTSNNFKLWDDLSKGYNRNLETYDSNFKRDGLLDIIPVDEFGNLLNPASIGLVKGMVSLPSGNIALGNKPIKGWNNDWKFGQIGPVEALWRSSSEFPFAIIGALYKQKPSNFINYFWDTSVNNNFTNRLKHSEIYMDGETDNSGNVVQKTGFNEWTSSLLKSKGMNITNNLGQYIRTLNVNLSHRVGGFTKEEDLVVYSDIYDEIPSENISVLLHKGKSLNPVYSGVTVLFDGTVYKVYGFDKINAYFQYYGVDTSGIAENIKTPNTENPVYKSWTKNTYYSENSVITYKGIWYICNTSHTSSTVFEDVFWDKTDKPDFNNSLYGKWYKNSTNVLKRINYGESFSTRQDVINFLNGLQAYYENNGFDFSNSSFKDSASEFLSWSNIMAIENSFIALSPFQDTVYYNISSGIIENTTQPYFYLYDISGNNISDFTTNRNQTDFTVSANNIFYCKLTVSTYEHVIIIDNTTIYGDKIYDPTINVRETRTLINGFTTVNWNGTMNAPGFIVTGNTIVPNFEKTVDNFRRYFDIETFDQVDMQNYARKNIGYAKKDYLTNLKLNDTNQFEFYQGMIKQKGTISSFNKLTRSNIISGTEDIQFAEEWAIRNGIYGNTNDKTVLQLSLSDTDINFDPQIIKFNTNYIDDSFSFTKDYKNDTLPNIANDSSDAELMTTASVIPGDVITNSITDDFGYSIKVSSITLTVSQIDQTAIVNILIGSETIVKNLQINEIFTKTFSTDITGNTITVETVDNSTGVFTVSLTGLNLNSYQNVLPSYVYSNGGVYCADDNTVLPSSLSLNGNIVITDGSKNFKNSLNNGSVLCYQKNSQNQQYLEINDYYQKNTNNIIEIDTRWQWRYDVRETGVNWNKTFSKPLLPTAGYVNVDWMDYYCNTTNDLLNFFNTEMSNNPTTVSDYSYVFTYDGISSNPSNIKTKIVPSKNFKGYGRINTINVNLKNPIPNNSLVINITQNGNIVKSIPLNNLSVGDNINYIFDFYSTDNTPNAIFVSFEYQDLKPIGYNISDITVSIECEFFENMMPNKNVWVYNDSGTWNTYKLQDTKIDNYKSYPPSFTDQGTIITLDNTFTDINNGDYIMISGSLEDSSGTQEDDFGYNTFEVKTSNTRILTINTNETNTYDLMEFISDGNMIIDSLVINNSVAINQETNPTVITIGNSTNKESILEGYIPPSTYTESNVMLYCDCLCSNSETSPPTEGTSYVTNTNCFNSNGVINVDISNSTIVYGDTTKTIPIQITRTGDIFNTITSATITNGGSGYTSVPTITINGASGYTATATIANGAVTSIIITNTGGCSLPLDTTPTISITGGGGSGAAATANVSNVADVPTVVGWRYKDTTNSGGWIEGGTLTFPVINDAKGNDFWYQLIEFTYPSLLQSVQEYSIEIYDINSQGYTITNSTTNITLYNDTFGTNSVNLGETGSTILSNIGQVQNNEEIYVYITNNTPANTDNTQPVVNCNLTITVNYHYTKGFELYQNSQPYSTQYNSYGGNVLKWKKTHFINETFVNPDGGWQEGDIIHIDYNVENKNWQVKKYENNTWQVVQSYINNYIDNTILSNVTLYSENKKITERFNVYNPLQNLLPGNFDKNIDFKSKVDPAKYNSSNTNEKHVWSFNEVGKTWWDLSTTFYIDYSLYGLNYTRDNWGKVVPDCDVRIYEWIRSPVAPNQWENYLSNGSYTYNSFDTNPSGHVDNENISYTQTSEWNNDINSYQDVYYFWVYNKGTLPFVKTQRNMTSAQITNYIKDINEFSEPFVGLLYDNSLILGNIKNNIKSDDSILKIVLNDSEVNQIHTEWNLIRETDTINSVPENIWNKFIDSICGYRQVNSYVDHNSETTTDIRTTSTSVVLQNVDNLPPCGEIRIGKSWLSYTRIQNNTLYGISSNTFIASGTKTFSKTLKTEYINVPDETLTDFEMYGINDQPLQSMIPVVKNSQNYYIPNRNVREALISSINSILLENNFIDNVSNWNLVFGSKQQEPNYYTYKISDISDLINLTLNQNDIILLEASNNTNNMWILYEYDPTNGKSDSNGLVIIDAQLWNINQNYIWNYADWYDTGFSSSDTPKYTFATMEEKNAFVIDEDVLLSGTLVKINQISKDDTRWTWQLHKDGLWSTVAIENGTLELTDVFYNNSFVLNLDNYSISNVILRDGSFELNYLLNNLNQIFTTEQINSIFFQTLRSVLNEEKYPNDWLIKTSYMYIDGYQEKLSVTEIEPIDTFSYIVEYIEEVKPYHVKIRDYLIQYVPENENLNAKITDFDFPTNSGTKLYPYTVSGTYGNTTYNGADTDTVKDNSPWKEWYSNYTKSYSMDVNNWSENWNGVRQFDIKIYIDNVGITDTAQWDNKDHWDFSIAVFNKNSEVSDLDTLKENYDIDTTKLITVERYYDLNSLLVSSDYDYSSIVYVILENKFYFFNGENWIEFFGKLWDKTSLTSSYDRITNLYVPTLTQNKDAKSLINSYYKGTVWFSGSFVDGDWDNYPWDWYSGFNNEDAYYTGFSDQLSNYTPTNNFSGYVPNLTQDYSSRDLDVIAPTLDNPAVYNTLENYTPNSGYYSTDILAWGSYFRDPSVDENSTSEKVELRITSSVVMKIIDTDSKIVFFKDYNDIWRVQNLTNLNTSEIVSQMKYNTGYSAIQNQIITDPTTLYLDFDLDMQNIVKIKEDVVLYDGTNDIMYSSDYNYVIPVIEVNGKIPKNMSNNVFKANIADTSIISNNAMYYWLDDEIISCEYIRNNTSGNSILYKLNRYLFGTHIPVISNNDYNIIESNTIVYNGSGLIPCVFDVIFDPKKSDGYYFKTQDGFGLYGITLVGDVNT